MADVDPDVKRKEVDELTETARKLLGAALRALLKRVESGDATAADMNAAARLIDLLGMDRLLTVDNAPSWALRDALKRLDQDESARTAAGDW